LFRKKDIRPSNSKRFERKFKPFNGGLKDLETLYLCPFQSIRGPYFTHSIGRRARISSHEEKGAGSNNQLEKGKDREGIDCAFTSFLK
jgi:hypothetical protein